MRSSCLTIVPALWFFAGLEMPTQAQCDDHWLPDEGVHGVNGSDRMDRLVECNPKTESGRSRSPL
ncbi:MAG: hypothetical protein AAB385_07950 [Planctomycetota bacterium]